MTGPVLPATLGRYRVDAVIGRGAMGVVYRAHDPVIDRPVAIKLVHADLLDGAERIDFLARFKREAQAAGRCIHPNIVTVYDYSDGMPPFLVMEFVEGQDLLGMLRRRGRLGPAETLPLLMQVLRGLGHAHAAGVVHRDIKPANIMQLDHGAVKITDFGVARLGRQNVTHAGSIVGTPSYMAPEQLRGAAVDGRADLFAVGVIAYEALTGRRPFAGRSATEVMARILNDPHEPLDPGFAAFPPSLVRIIDKALAKDPAARFPSAAAFAQELEPALRDAARTSPAVVPDDATLIRGAPVPPPAPAAIGATAGMTLGGTPLDPAALSRIEQDLTRHLGPVAKVLVRKAAAGAGDLGEVYTRLAPNLPAEADRTRFLDLGRRHGGTLTGSGSTGIGGTGIGGTGIGVSGTGAGPSSPPTAARITLRPEAQARAEQALAKFMGPVARILVRQALVQAGSLRDFYAKLAAHIPREEDRAAFRRQLKEDWGPGFDR